MANKIIILLGHPPATALFAINARYKRESYRGSEFAPRILAQEGLDVVMKVVALMRFFAAVLMIPRRVTIPS